MITNTESQDPIVHLFEAMGAMERTGSPSQAIVDQEARGQREACGQTSQLPTQIDEGDTLALKAWGFEFLGPCPGDPLFQKVRFPAGWRLEPTDHSMWSNLVDSEGGKRGAVFYKAAFYDRRAHLRLNNRYAAQKNYSDDGKQRTPGIFDHKTGTFTPTAETRAGNPVWYDLEGEERRAAMAEDDAWEATEGAALQERYPLYAGSDYGTTPEEQCARRVAYWEAS